LSLTICAIGSKSLKRVILEKMKVNGG